MMQSDSMTLKDKKKIKDKEISAKIKWENAIAYITNSEHGMLFLQKLIERTDAMTCVFDSNNSIQSFKSGKQDVGLWVLNQIRSVNEKSYSDILIKYKKGE